MCDNLNLVEENMQNENIDIDNTQIPSINLAYYFINYNFYFVDMLLRYKYINFQTTFDTSTFSVYNNYKKVTLFSSIT